MSPREPAGRGATGGGAGAYQPGTDGARDAELVDRVRAGQPECFTMLVEHHQRPLYGFVASHRLDPEAAADLVQEAFLKAYRGIGTFDARRSSFKTWLYTIAFNLIRDGARRLAVRTRGAEELQHQAALAVPRDETARIEARDEVQRILSHLDEESREIVAMKFLADMPYRQISEITGLPEVTIRSRVHRALKRLKAATAAGAGAAAAGGGGP